MTSRREFLLSPSAVALTAALRGSSAGSAAFPRFLWLAGKTEPDTYVAFRGSFEISAAEEIELRFLGASWFVLWLDCVFFSEGPVRFPRDHPEYQHRRARLEPGRHVLTATVHHEGVSTRLLDDVAPFWMCQVRRGDAEVPVEWRAARPAGFQRQVRRINPQLGWIEWADTRKQPGPWEVPVEVHPDLGTLQPVGIGEVQAIAHSLEPSAQGEFVEAFGYETDDPSARFFLRRLDDRSLPPQGLWRRYDLGRVRLGRPRFVLDLPAGAVVEFAVSEALEKGRVTPWITLSAGMSANLDHYVARGGEQEFFPLTPKGGRFLEVHIVAAPDKVRFVHQGYLERTYHGDPEGGFESGDPLLDRIWRTGVETYRACSEDAVIDNPTRERGQWAGDVVSVGMEIAGTAYSDLRLFRRGLLQCAYCAREDGLVAGLCPGGRQYLSTYAAQWVTACLRYWQLTGEKDLLTELLPAARRNMAAFGRRLGPDGPADDIGWAFVDWGYVRNEGSADMGVTLHLLASVRDQARWCETLGLAEESAHYSRLARRLSESLSAWFDRALASPRGWETVGLHRAVLGLRLGLLTGAREREAVAAIKRRIESCFPLDVSAPRLSDPGAANPRLFTPYFAHYTMPELAVRGEMDFVLDVYRKAWGWALEDGRTTWVEVFDTRWSHCHQWAGCPTWQLSRFVLGLDRRFDLGPLHFALDLRPGSLPAASGRLPLPGGQIVQVSWKRTAGDIRYRFETPTPIVLHPRQSYGFSGPVRVERSFEHTFASSAVS